MTDPWRKVVGAKMRSGRGGLLGPDTDRRVRWWELSLECGHLAERFVKYGPRTDGRLRGAARDESDALPAPRRVLCEKCGASGRMRP